MGLIIEIVAGARSSKFSAASLNWNHRVGSPAPRRARPCASRAPGLRIALDDLVTGYPFDKLKIDQSFARDVTGSRRIETGVETVEHLMASGMLLPARVV